MSPSTRLEDTVKGTARTREIGPEEAHARNVEALGRRIANKQRQLRQALSAIKRLRGELRRDRRELRAVLQRDSSVTITGDNRLQLAGLADATDRAVALSEARPPAAPPCKDCGEVHTAEHSCEPIAGYDDDVLGQGRR